MQSGAEPAEKMIRELVACEHEYINTDHPDFIGGTRAVKVGWGCQLRDRGEAHMLLRLACAAQVALRHTRWERRGEHTS